MVTIRGQSAETSLRRVAMVCGAAVMIFGIFGLAGWLTGLRGLASLSREYIPMAPGTAWSFLFLGSVLLLHGSRGLKGRGLALALVILTTVFGFLNLLEYFIGIDLSLEEVLFPAAQKFGLVVTNRMSPMTGAGLFLSGTTLFLLLRPYQTTRNLPGVLGSLVAILGLIGTVGYLFGTPLLYGGDVIPMAVTTTIAFLLLGVGLTAMAGPEGFPLRALVGSSVRARLLRVFLPLTGAIIFAHDGLHEIIPGLFGNHAMTAALLALGFAGVAVLLVTVAGGAISHDLDRAGAARQQAEETLRETAGTLQAIIQAAPLSIIVLDREGRVQLWNPASARIFGWTAEEVIGRPYPIVPEGKMGEFQENLKRALTGESLAGVELTRRKKDGSPIDISICTAPMYDPQGEITAILGLNEDITERKRAEEALQRAEREFRLVAGNIPAIVFKGYLDGSVEFFDDRVEAMTGYPREEFDTRRRSWTDLICEDDQRDVKEIFIKALKGSGIYVREYRINTKTGEVVWVQERSCIVHNPEGKVDYVSGVLFDITARKREEEALRESEEKYRIVADYNRDWEYWLGPDGDLIYVSPSCERITGYRAEEFYADPQLIKTLIHPDDLLLLAGHFLDDLKETLGAEEIQYRIITKDGQERWLSHYCQPTYSTDGRWLGRRGSNRDITRLKEAEAEVKQGLEKLRLALRGTVEALANTVETKDPYTAGHHRRVAQLAGAMAQELGWPPDQVRGIQVLSLLHDLGKIAVPAEILSKPGKISPAEFNLIKAHPQVGYDILKDIEFPWPVAQAVLQHHERLNGSGYPSGLTAGEIIPEARVLAVADVVEAMASHRPYRPALGVETALEEITNHKGKLYDPAVVDICVKLFTEKGFAFDELGRSENFTPTVVGTTAAEKRPRTRRGRPTESAYG